MKPALLFTFLTFFRDFDIELFCNGNPEFLNFVVIILVVVFDIDIFEFLVVNQFGELIVIHVFQVIPIVFFTSFLLFFLLFVVIFWFFLFSRLFGFFFSLLFWLPSLQVFYPPLRRRHPRLQ